MSRLNKNRSIKVVKILRSFTGLLLSLTLFTSVILSQERDSLIQLYPGIGDTIDLFDREFFNLYSDIDGYQKASLFIRDNSKLVSRLQLDISSELVDTAFIQPLSILKKVRTEISKIDKENDNRLKIEADVLISLNDSRSISGRLSMYSKNYLYLISENEVAINFPQSNTLKIPVSNVNQINMLGKNKTWSYAGWGALIGLVVGGISYFSTNENNSTNTSIDGGGFNDAEIITAPIFGGLIGLIIGGASSTNDEVYRIDSEYDLLKLKDYAKYYFQYDESVEKIYVELE